MPLLASASAAVAAAWAAAAPAGGGLATPTRQGAANATAAAAAAVRDAVAGATAASAAAAVAEGAAAAVEAVPGGGHHGFQLQGGDIIMLLLTMTVLLRLFNHHYVHLPSAIMMSLGSITCTGALLVVGLLPNVDMGFALAGLRDFLMNFPDLLLKYMLGFLLFAAAIEVDLRALRRIRTTVIALSVFTTAISCGIVSVLTWLLLRRICPMDFAWCLLFGAIVSPTDPVAVMSLLSAKPDLIPASTRYFVLGESLFNDAVGVVLYLVFVETVEKPDMPIVEVWRLFFRGFGLECLSGIGIGLVLSWLAYSAIQTLDDSLLEITISIVLVGNINLACNYFHASIPLASVTAGLFIGNYGVAYAMSDDTSALFHQLWKFLDETLNSVLFLLVGAADLFWNPQDIGLVPYAMVMVATIAISLFARIISVAAPLLSIVALEVVTGRRLRHRSVRYRGGTIAVLTWGGVRGGISIALALGVPDAFVKHAVPGHMTYGQLIFLMTFTLVVFSICGQGLLFETVVKLIEDMSYTFLPHGGLSTFKSSMSLAFDQDSAISADGHDWGRLPHSDSWADEEVGGIPTDAPFITDMARGGVNLYSEEGLGHPGVLSPPQPPASAAAVAAASVSATAAAASAAAAAMASPGAPILAARHGGSAPPTPRGIAQLSSGIVEGLAGLGGLASFGEHSPPGPPGGALTAPAAVGGAPGGAGGAAAPQLPALSLAQPAGPEGGGPAARRSVAPPAGVEDPTLASLLSLPVGATWVGDGPPPVSAPASVSTQATGGRRVRSFYSPPDSVDDATEDEDDDGGTLVRHQSVGGLRRSVSNHSTGSSLAGDSVDGRSSLGGRSFTNRSVGGRSFIGGNSGSIFGRGGGGGGGGGAHQLVHGGRHGGGNGGGSSHGGGGSSHGGGGHQRRLSSTFEDMEPLAQLPNVGDFLGGLKRNSSQYLSTLLPRRRRGGGGGDRGGGGGGGSGLPAGPGAAGGYPPGGVDGGTLADDGDGGMTSDGGEWTPDDEGGGGSLRRSMTAPVGTAPIPRRTYRRTGAAPGGEGGGGGGGPPAAEAAALGAGRPPLYDTGESSESPASPVVSGDGLDDLEEPRGGGSGEPVHRGGPVGGAADAGDGSASRPPPPQ